MFVPVPVFVFAFVSLLVCISTNRQVLTSIQVSPSLCTRHNFHVKIFPDTKKRRD